MYTRLTKLTEKGKTKQWENVNKKPKNISGLSMGDDVRNCTANRLAKTFEDQWTKLVRRWWTEPSVRKHDENEHYNDLGDEMILNTTTYILIMTPMMDFTTK